MTTSALWDDEGGVVHQVVRGDSLSVPVVWRLVCNNVVSEELHVNSSRCVVVTCLWCVQGAKGPWFPIQ